MAATKSRQPQTKTIAKHSTSPTIRCGRLIPNCAVLLMAGFSLDTPWVWMKPKRLVQMHHRQMRRGRSPPPPKESDPAPNLGATIDSGWFPSVSVDDSKTDRNEGDNLGATIESHSFPALSSDDFSLSTGLPEDDEDATPPLGATIASGSFPPVSPGAPDSTDPNSGNLGATLDSHSFALDSQYGDGFSFAGPPSRKRPTMKMIPTKPRQISKQFSSRRTIRVLRSIAPLSTARRNSCWAA